MTETHVIAKPRWELTLRGPESLADDLGFVGTWVGPRTGPLTRTKGQKEDYVLRRLLVAWKLTGRLRFPMEIRAAEDEEGTPDFLFAWPEGETLGVEVTEAGDEDYQAWLTRTEGKREPYRDDGSVGDDPERKAAADIFNSINKKVDEFDKGKYRAPDKCDLVVYDNSETGWMSDRQLVLNFLGRPNDLVGRFRQVHLVSGKTVFLDIFASEFGEVDVSKAYEIDYAAWAFDQVEKLRAGATDKLDLADIAEELESLARSERRTVRSHLRNLMAHLLKWEHQPAKRSPSWLRTIDNSRGEIEDAIADSPSLGSEDFLSDAVKEQYPKARRRAIREAKLASDMIPQDCPFTLEQLFDPDYPPVGEKEPTRS